MKKNVLALLLAAFMLIGLLVVGAPNAQAEETAVHENHCVCGGAAVGVHDHECATIEWQPLPEGTTDFGTLATGNYYLTADVAVTNAGWIGSSTVQKEISICLNGHNITSSNTRVFGYTWAGNVLNVCDCSYDAEKGTFGGTVTAGTGSGKYGCVVYTYSKSELNVYGGNFTSLSTTAINGSVFEIANDQCSDVDGNGKIQNADKNYFSEASTLNMYNGNVYGSVSTSGVGGLIHSFHSPAVNIHGGTISGGQSEAAGGNIYVAGNGQVTITGGTITGGTAVNGGNIYAKNLTITGGNIAGGIANGTATMTANTTTDEETNETTTTYTYSASGFGGNICIASGGKLTLSGGSIYDGSCTGNPIYNTATKEFVVRESGTGGNIFIDSNATFVMTGGKVYDGFVNGIYGGNIYTRGTSAEITGGLIWGGTVNADGSEAGTEQLRAAYDLLGGSIAFLGGTNTIGGDASVGINDKGEAAGGWVPKGGEGGNLYIGATTYIKGNAVIANGVANTNGSGKGGNITGGSKLYIQENAVIKDGVAAHGGNITLFNAGVSNAFIEGGTISGGSAVYGGNIVVDGNNATLHTLTITGGTITGGTASIRGGNILLQHASKAINVSNAVISNGTAAEFGGNIYTSGKMTITDCTISGGTASNADGKDSRGGNIYVNASTMEISGGTISGGQASHGGNLDLNDKSVVTITNCAISDGVANLQCYEKKVGNGGNIHAEYGSNLTITGGSLTGGTAFRGGSIGAFSTVNITGCTISGGYATYAGGNVFVFNMGNVTMDSTTTVSDGISAADGGNFIVTYGGTAALNGTTVSGGKAGTSGGFGGNILVEGRSGDKTRASSMTINNCAITGGDAKYGGSVAVKVYGVCTISGSTVETSTGTTGRVAYVADGGTLTVKDSTLNNTTTVSAKNGTCIWNCGTLILQGTVKLSDAADEDVTYQTMDLMVDARDGAAATIDVSGLTGQDAPYGIRRWEIDGTDDDCGLLATGATETHKDMFFAWRAGYEISYADGCLYLAPNAVQIMNGINVINGYATLDEAMADTAEATHYVLYASMDGQTISKDILLDLNGKHLTNTTVNEGVTVQLYDTANNGFDASACGSLSGTVSGTMEVMTRSQDNQYAYVVVCENDVYSAHRFYRAMNAISLNPSADALGYKAAFKCDDVLSKYVVDYGFQLWVGDGSVKSYGKSEFVSGNLTLRLKNILAAGGGEMEISGRAYIIFEVDGEQYSSIGSTTTTTMKDTVEAVNTAYAADNTVYSAAQMSAVQALLTKYADATSGWAVADILAWSAPATDDSTEA